MDNILNPYFNNKQSNYDYKPNDIIYVPSLEITFGDAIMKPLATSAYRTIEDLKEHAIWKDSPNLKIKEMRVIDFLKRRLHNYQSVNEFHRLKEFVEKYEEKYGIKIGVKNDQN